MITTKELYEWRDKMLNTYLKAVEESEKAKNKVIAEYYSAMALVASNQMAVIERLIRQSEENEKEQICQK